MSFMSQSPQTDVPCSKGNPDYGRHDIVLAYCKYKSHLKTKSVEQTKSLLHAL